MVEVQPPAVYYAQCHAFLHKLGKWERVIHISVKYGWIWGLQSLSPLASRGCVSSGGNLQSQAKARWTLLWLPVWLSRHHGRKKVHSLPLRALSRSCLWSLWKGNLEHSSLLCKRTFRNRTWEGHTIKIPFGPFFLLIYPNWSTNAYDRKWLIMCL